MKIITIKNLYVFVYACIVVSSETIIILGKKIYSIL